MSARRSAVVSRVATALVVVAPSVAIGALAGLVVERQTRAQRFQQQRAELEALTEAVSSDVRSRVERYQFGLRGIRGAVLVAGAELSRERVRVYGESRDLPSEFPGALGFGFARRVERSSLESFVAHARSERPDGFAIRSFAPHRNAHIVIEYVAPEAPNRAAIGLDLASDPVRAAATLASARTGEPTLTAPLTLVQATVGDPRGALFVLPIYRAGSTPRPSERHEQLIGWAFAPLLMATVLRCNNYRCDEYAIAVRDVANGRETPAFESPAYRSGASTLVAHRNVSVFGRRWKLSVQATPMFFARDRSLSPSIAGWFAALTAALSSALVISTLLFLDRRRRNQAELRALNDELEVRVKERTSALASASALQRVILEAAGSAIIGTDVAGTITVWNQAAERLLGYRSDEVVGVQTPAIVHVESEVLARRRELEAERGPLASDFDVFVCNVRDGGTEAREWTYRRKDGSELPVLLTVSAIRDENDRLQGFLGVAVDLTAQGKIARELEQLNALLEERTAQAESASKAKSLFVASMSHEIRTPMNAIAGASFLLDRTELTSAQRELLMTVRTASSALLSMLNDVLDLSKIEAGQLAIIANPFRLRATLNEVETMLGGLARDKSLAFHVVVDPALEDYWIGDKTRLTQILTNLLGNAIKFTAQGEVRLEVTPVGEAGTTMRFVVSDTGKGIPDDAIPRLFATFFQVDSSSTAPSGTGLGLAIVRHLAAMMGGSVRVESRLGKGTTFVVELPFEPDPSRELEPPASTQTSDATTKRERLSGCTALVVDDHPVNVRIARALLEAEGAIVTTASDAREALRLLRADPLRYRVVLMDVQMPEMSGIEATRLLREDERFAGLPIIALTAGAMEEERRAAEQAGMTGFITKPVDPNVLIALVREQLRGSSRLATRRSDPQERDAWPTIDGVSSADASRRFSGRFELFRGLLEAMLEDAGDPRALAIRSDAVDLRVVERAMHRLKGAAANLAATDLAREASKAESAARANELQATIDALDAVTTQLERLRASLEGSPARRVRDEVDAANEKDPELDLSAFVALERLLRDNDLEAIARYQAMRGALEQRASAEQAATLRRAIERLDFSVAADIVKQLASCS